jgi:hypothetical protein
MVWNGVSAVRILECELVGRMPDWGDGMLKVVEGRPCPPSRKPPPGNLSSRHPETPLAPEGSPYPKKCVMPSPRFSKISIPGVINPKSHRNSAFLKLVPYTPITPRPSIPRPSPIPPGPSHGGMVGLWVPNLMRASRSLAIPARARVCVRTGGRVSARGGRWGRPASCLAEPTTLMNAGIERLA